MAEAPAGLVPPKFNIDQPRFKQISKKPIVKAFECRWDQSTYWGRARQFFTTTNTLNLFVTPAQLDQAKVEGVLVRHTINLGFPGHCGEIPKRRIESLV